MTGGEEDGWDAVQANIGSLTLDGGEPAGQSSDGLANSGTATNTVLAATPAGRSQRDGAVLGPHDEHGIDKAILDALGSPKRRQVVLRFEEAVESFLRDKDQMTHFFDMTHAGALGSGYQRLLAHRVAQHYGLETKTVESGEMAGRVTAMKTGNERFRQPLRDVPVPDSHESAPTETTKVLSRPPKRTGPTNGRTNAQSNGNVQPGAPPRNIPERHNSYNEVRERLVGNGQLPPRNAPRGFGRGPLPGRGIMGAGRGQDRGKGGGRGREEEVKDPDYQRFQGPFGNAPYPPDGRQPPYTARPYVPEMMMHPPMMMTPDGQYVPSAGIPGYTPMQMPYVMDPNMNPMQPPMHAMQPMPGMPVYGSPQAPYAYMAPYWPRPGQEGVMGVMQPSFMYGGYPPYGMPVNVPPANAQGKGPHNRGSASNPASRRNATGPAASGDSNAPAHRAPPGGPVGHLNPAHQPKHGREHEGMGRQTRGPGGPSSGGSSVTRLHMQGSPYASAPGPGGVRPQAGALPQPVTLPKPPQASD
eukprot:jgi/Botrbrau1/14142/Bobra.182_3s0083.1